MAPHGKTLLVIPTYNERSNLERLVQTILEERMGLDLLIVDDHSPDGTGAVADALARRLPVTVLHRRKKLGIGSAHKAGLRYAIDRGYTFVLTMDADFSHSPEYLRPMLQLAPTADLVIGSRYVAGGGFDRFPTHRLLLTKTVHWMTTHLLGLPYDCTGGLRVYRVATLRSLEMRRVPSDGHAFLIEMAFQIRRQGGRIVEHPIIFRPRQVGTSKVSGAELVRAAAAFSRLSLQRFVPPWRPSRP